MKICMIAEGSYPYITGGVSSWIQMLVSSMPEHSFTIYAIGAQEKDRGRFNYKLPENVTGVEEVFLDNSLQEKGRLGKRLHLKARLKEDLKELFAGRLSDWSEVFSYFYGCPRGGANDLLMSRDLFDILSEVYRDNYAYMPFTSFFWTARSMAVPLFHVMSRQIPQADLYHSVSTGYAGIAGSMAGFLTGRPFLLTEHGIYTREREEEIIKSDWIKGYFKDIWISHFFCLSQCTYAKADKVITLFGRNKEIQIELGCSAEKIAVIPNGVHPDSFAHIPQKDPGEGFVQVGAVVRIVSIKDIKTMLQAFAVALEHFPQIRFYIMGPLDEDPAYYEECRQMMDSLGVRNVIFTGKVNIVEYIGKMDLLVLSSISEGQPLAILEGMAAGKAFVATDVGSCRELLYGNDDHFGEAGVVVPVMDYEEMGQTIAMLCRSRELRVQMGRNAFRRVSELYSREKLIGAYKNLYKTYGEIKHGGNRI